MIIPKYWAEARLRHRDRKRQLTVRRFGWSDTSEADALAHADRRTHDALERILQGEALPGRERRVAYNGADGLPIREEVVDRYAETVVTRNAYGALCLNTPNVLFADIDEPDQGSNIEGGMVLLFLAVGVAVFSALRFAHWGNGGALMTAFLAGWLVAKCFARLRRRQGSVEAWEARARARITDFLGSRPDWRLRVYRTPAGLRLMATHRLFDPREPEVDACFTELGVDPVYARMCRNQNCFRARVSPKPWRIGLQRIRPPSAAWRPEHADLPARRDWIARYDEAAQHYASCRFVESLGGGTVDPRVETAQQLHDLLSQAESGLPIA